MNQANLKLIKKQIADIKKECSHKDQNMNELKQTTKEISKLEEQILSVKQTLSEMMMLDEKMS